MAREADKLTSAILVLEGGDDVENIWVKKKRGNRCEVRTIPFWAYNLSFGDTVQCVPDEDGVGLFIDKVLEKSGNQTVRVGFKGPQGARHPEAVKFRRFLNRHHFDYEFSDPNLFAINVPSDEIYEKLLARIEKIPASAQMIWEDGDPQPGVNLDGSDMKGKKRQRKARRKE